MNDVAGRRGQVERKTFETDIRLELGLDGAGDSDVSTGIGFFDHVLGAWARHGFFDLKVSAKGDLHVDGHHTVEDVGICLGRALRQALGPFEGIKRFGNAVVPMDEALVHAAVDVSGRPFLAFDLGTDEGRVGEFDACLTEEFFRAFVAHSGLTLHLRKQAGSNLHHIIEAAFKACGRALDEATGLDGRVRGALSTKGSLV